MSQGVLRGNGSNAYTWVGGSAPTFSVIKQDSGASAWSVAVSVSANTVTFTVTGLAGEDIVWMAKVETLEAAG